jgi:O-antigen/teichoic acid export membrane protein
MAPQADNLTAVATRNAVTAAASRVTDVLVAMLLTPFVLHRLGADLYGVVVAAGSAFEYLSLLRGGMGAALRRYVTVALHSSDHALAKTYYAVGFWWAGILRAGILILAVLLAAPICRFLRLPPSTLHDATFGVALILVAAAVNDTATMLNIPIFATGNLAPLSVVRMVTEWTRLALVYSAFVLLAANLSTYGGVMVVVQIIGVLAMIWLIRRLRVLGPAIPRPQLGGSKMRRELFQYGGFALLSQAAGLLYVSTDNLLIGRIYGVGAVTSYSLGTRWSPMIMGFLVSAIASLTPLFTQLEVQGETDRGRDALSRVVALTAALAVPMCLVPCIVGDIFLARWVGPQYRGSAAYLIAMLVPLTIEATLAPVWMALTARGRIGWIAVSQIIVAVGNVGISLVLALVLGLGLLGFALGNTLALVAKNLLLIGLIRNPGSGLPSATSLFRPFTRALIGGAPALVVLYAARPIYDASLAQVVAAGLVGGGVCLLGSAYAAVGRGGVANILRALRTRRRPGGRSDA